MKILDDIQILNQLTTSNFIDPYIDVLCIKFLFNPKFNLAILRNDKITPEVIKYVLDIFTVVLNMIVYFQRTTPDNHERHKVAKYIGIYVFNVLKIIQERRPKFKENIHTKNIQSEIMKILHNTTEIPDDFQILTLEDADDMLKTIVNIIKTSSTEYNDIQKKSLLYPYNDKINNLRIIPLQPDIEKSLTQFMARESIILNKLVDMKENGMPVSDLARTQIQILTRMFNTTKQGEYDEHHIKALHGYILDVSKPLKSLKK